MATEVYTKPIQIPDRTGYRWCPEPLRPSTFGLQIIAFDLDAYPDLIPSFAFIALGLVLGDREQPLYAVYGSVAAIVAISVVTLGALSVAQTATSPEAATIDALYRGAERPALPWRSVQTEPAGRSSARLSPTPSTSPAALSTTRRGGERAVMGRLPPTVSTATVA